MNTSQAASPSTSSVTALVVSGVAGGSSFLAMPAVVGALSQAYGLTDVQIGRFSFLQLSGISAGCVLSLLLAGRLSTRTTAIVALALLAAVDVATIFAGDYSLLLGLRALAGVGGGLAIANATGGLARSSNPDRGFGWFLFAQIVFQMVAIWSLPRVAAAAGASSVFVVLATLEAVVLFAVPRFLSTGVLSAGSSGAGGGNDGRAWLWCGVVLLSILTFFMAVGSFWTFVGRIGEQLVGLKAAEVGSALSVAGIGGLLGAFLPALAGSRFGRALPILVAVAAVVAGMLLMQGAATWTAFTIAAGFFSLGWFLLYPYQLGVLAAIDRDGRPALAAAALTGIGLGIGPALVASRIGTEGLRGLFPVALVCIALAGVLVLAALALGVRRPPAVLAPAGTPT